MKLYHGYDVHENETGGLYLASDVDHELSQMASAVECKGNEIVGLKERIAELEAALRFARDCLGHPDNIAHIDAVLNRTL